MLGTRGPGKVMLTTTDCGMVIVSEGVRSCSLSRSTDRSEYSRIMAWISPSSIAYVKARALSIAILL